MTDRILRRPEVEHLSGMGRSALYQAIQAGDFPAPVRITRRAVGWRESAVRAWIDARPTARNEDVA